MKTNLKTLALASALCVPALASTPTHAETLRWAYPGDVNAMDPYSLTESFSIAFRAGAPK